MDYRTAGVDIAKGDRLVDRIKSIMGESGGLIGHFGGAIPLPIHDYKSPMLVSSIDSVGTKVKIASAMKRYDTAGRDMVHHAVNDIAVCGAEPIGFLDYIAMSKLDESVVEAVVSGIVGSCKKLEIALVGGELAEMPGVYRDGEFDIVGSVFGVVEKDKYIRGDNISAGDVLVGFPSAGLHTNGFSLARMVFDTNNISYDKPLNELDTTVGNALLEQHICYLDEIRSLKIEFNVKGLAHITGGGLTGNVQRIIPAGLTFDINWGVFKEPAIFGVIRSLGNVPEDDMRKTFNLGIGLVAVLNPADAKRVLSDFPKDLLKPIEIGIVNGN